MKHYHVIAGLRGGYIPNTNEVYATKKSALDEASRIVDYYHEVEDKVRGSRKAGYWVAREGMFPGEFYDFIEVTGPCTEDCESELAD